MDMVLISKVFISVIFDYFKFESFIKPLKTKSKPILKNVSISWYGEIILKILKEKLIKSIRIKAHLEFLIMYP
jgi:uncharacterized membrane protein YqhA